jgi:alkylhydroperoxidase family enzyme
VNRAYGRFMSRPRPTSPRLPPLDPASLDAETQRYVPADALNIFRTLAHHPKLLKRWMVFANHVLAKSTLPERERELVILHIGWRCRAEYEFGQHTVLGHKAGLSDAEIIAITQPPADYPWSSDDRTLLEAADELHDDQCITEETWSTLTQKWNDQQVLDLIFTIGQYTLVSMALNSLGVELDAGVPGFPQ